MFNYEQISHIALLFPLLTLNKQMSAWYIFYSWYFYYWSFNWSHEQKQPPEGFYKNKLFLKISQNLQENICARVSFLIKLQASILLKKRLRHRCYSVNLAKFLITAVSKNILFYMNIRGVFRTQLNI